MAALPADLRRRDRERWLSVLWAPAGVRAGLAAIHAFDCEQERIVATIGEPMMGEMRLAWWRERVEDLVAGQPPRGHPILMALAAARDAGADLRPLARTGDGLAPLLWDEPLEALALATLRGSALVAALASAGGMRLGADACAGPGRRIGLAAMLRAERWGERGPRIAGLALAALNTSAPMGRATRMPAFLGTLDALAAEDCDRAATGRRLRVAGGAGRQWRMAKAALGW